MSHAHLAAAQIDAPADFALTQLADARAIGRWTLGSMDFTPLGDGLWQGTSLFDGATSIVEIVAHRALGLIDYHVGTAEARVPRISIRVTPGPDWGLRADQCLAAMTTWRAGWMEDDRWERTRKTHEVEALLFKAQIETAWRQARP